MYVRHNPKYGKELIIIHPGELYATSRDELIGTLLGSCVAVCLFDLQRGIAGMNHFMLPGKITEKDLLADRQARYGITAINSLLAAMDKEGASRTGLIAKVYGGGHVLESVSDTHTIPFDNVRVARVMLEVDDIHIEHSDVGGNYTRKLMLDVKSGKVYLKKTTRAEVFQEISRRELEYLRRGMPNG